MRLFIWYLGRALQFIALLQVGAALIIGMKSGDVKLELTLLTLGVIEFLVGALMLKGSGSPS